MKVLHRYTYDGPVMEFDTCVYFRWVGETMAPSESKARSNLKYQYKKKYNKTPGAKITLPGKIKMVKEE